VVGAYVQVDSVLVFALFDRSASHSFISANLVKTIERVKCSSNSKGRNTGRPGLLEY